MCGILLADSSARWGNNGNGQTTVPAVTEDLTGGPGWKSLAAGGYHTCGVTKLNSTTLYWGWNDYASHNMLVAGHPMTSPPGAFLGKHPPALAARALSHQHYRRGAGVACVGPDASLDPAAPGPGASPGPRHDYSAEAGTLGSRLSRRRIVGSGSREGPLSKPKVPLAGPCI